MNRMEIAFPNLGVYLKNIPKAFTVFGVEITLYGCIIATGIILGILLAEHMAKRTGQDPEIYWEFAIYAVIFSVIGARLYYVVFSWDRFKDNLWSVFNTRAGGMAIYGAVIAAVITLLVFAKRKKQNPFLMGDTCVFGLILGQIIGRFGNFTNREAFGEYTDGLFAMRIPIEDVRSFDITEKIALHITEGINYIQVHPTFLYESMWNALVLMIMLCFRKYKKFHGEICLLYLGGYGLGRFFIEGLRTDQLLLPGSTIAVSQLLSLCILVSAILLDCGIRLKSKI